MPKYICRKRTHGLIANGRNFGPVRNSSVEPEEMFDIFDRIGHPKNNDSHNPLEGFFNKPENDVYREDNHIYYRCDVSIESISKLITLIEECNRDIRAIQANCEFGTFLPKPIYLHITTTGGNLHAGLMCYDAIRRSKVPIHTVADGYAISAGSIMLMAGATKMMTPNSIVLIHQLSTVTAGTYENHVDSKTNLDKVMGMMKKIYKENTKMTMKEIEGMLKRDLELDADQCLKRGIVDGIWIGQD